MRLKSVDSALRKLDFCIAGAQKAGTTALSQYLQQHPTIFIPAKKELHLFNRPLDFPWKRRRATDIRISAHFRMAQPDQICGESTPAYLYWPDSFKLAKDHNSDIKIIICLRHPGARAYSAWQMETVRGRETMPFHYVIRAGRDRVVSAPHGIHKIFSYVERGFYAPQLNALFNCLPKDQIHFIKSNHIKAESPALQRLLAFLDIPYYDFCPLNQNVFQTKALQFSDTLSDDLAFLQDIYMEDMAQTSKLIDLDISEWMIAPPTPASLLWSYDG